MACDGRPRPDKPCVVPQKLAAGSLYPTQMATHARASHVLFCTIAADALLSAKLATNRLASPVLLCTIVASALTKMATHGFGKPCGAL